MTEAQQIKEVDFHFNVKILAHTENKTWDEAQKWAKEQGGRVPTVAELQILSALQRMGKLDTKFNGWFWSSEEHSNNPQGHGRLVLFNDGSANYGGKYGQYQVLCLGK